MSNDQLLPCPFCGSEAAIQEHEPHKHHMSLGDFKMPDYPGSFTIECTGPGCNTGQIADTRDEVVAMWNRRAASQQPIGAALPDLSAPCKFCEGTRKQCGMNCGPSALGRPRTRKESLETCSDCGTCHCRWRRIGFMQEALHAAAEQLPPDYRLVIDVARDEGVVYVIDPGAARKMIEGDGYLAEDVRAGIEWAKQDHQRNSDETGGAS